MANPAGGSISGGPYRIDNAPQNPTFYDLPTDKQPATVAANAPFTLIGDTSTAAIEVTQGWPHQRPAEAPAREVGPV